MDDHDVHPEARAGFARAADSYSRGRPEYPPAVIDWLRERVGLGPGTLAIELGAGTGKFTRALLRSGARIIAVEPVEPMRARLQADLPQVTALAGSAQAIPAPDECADAVVCAQAFHWFATPQALGQISRVLRPGGTLALVWNVPDDSVPWVLALMKILSAYDQDCPQQFRHGNWRKAFPDPHFEPLQLQVFTHSQSGSAQQVIIERAKSLSYIANLPPPGQAAVVGKLQTLIDSEPALGNGRELAFPYRTLAYHCRKRTDPRA